MNYKFLTTTFYQDHTHCPEIEQKLNRPYAVFIAKFNGIKFAIPFRSHINHEFAFMTDKENCCGLDYSKAVPVLKPGYIDQARVPIIRENEHKFLLGKEYQVYKGLEKYIKTYKEALRRQDIPRNAMFCKYSCLQYFHKQIGEV